MRKHKQLFGFLLVTSLLLSFGLHKFYVGIIQLNFNTNTEQFELSIKIFTDDLEAAIEQQSGQKISIADGSKDLNNPLIFEYVKANLQFKMQNEEVSAQWVGYEYQQDVTWLFLAFDASETFYEIELTCKLLQEMFEEQTFITRIEKDNQLLKSYLLRRMDATIEYHF